MRQGYLNGIPTTGNSLQRTVRYRSRFTIVQSSEDNTVRPAESCESQPLWLDVFDEQVARSPSDIASIADTEVLTYAELSVWSHFLGNTLREAGVGPGEPVAVIVHHRSPSLTAAMLAIWRLGAVYVPILADDPVVRIHEKLALCSIKIALLDRGAYEPGLPADVRRIPLLHYRATGPMLTVVPPYPGIEPDDLAYIIFTSGSTGAPKPVAVPHRGITAIALATAHALQLGPGTRMLQFAAASFDASISEAIATLAVGATGVYPDPNRAGDGEGLAEIIAEQSVSHAIMVPTVLATIPEQQVPAGLRLVVAGEAVNRALIREWSRRHTLINSYGPTETTIGVTISTTLTSTSTRTPIGHPIPGSELRVVGSDGIEVAHGVVGELWIGGIGVAHGYLGMPDATAESFITDPHNGRRYFRTGDLVSRLPDGQFDYHGRIDRRIKLRGRRIEPGEIEATALEVPGVRQVAVLAIDDQLVCYVVGAGEHVQEPLLRAALASQLPSYLLPDRFSLLPEMPRTTHGKIDYAALAASEPKPTPSLTVARTPAEQQLCAMFAAVLRLPTFGPDDNFFSLGGESMSAAGLTRRIRTEFGVQMTMRTLLEMPTPASLAAWLSAPTSGSATPR